MGMVVHAASYQRLILFVRVVSLSLFSLSFSLPLAVALSSFEQLQQCERKKEGEKGSKELREKKQGKKEISFIPALQPAKLRDICIPNPRYILVRHDFAQK